jgi:hypothetical protein
MSADRPRVRRHRGGAVEPAAPEPNSPRRPAPARPEAALGNHALGRLVQARRAEPGQPLPAAVRDELEPHFGTDLGGVRVHTGTAATESAQAAGALAYTLGDDVVFGAGQFRPDAAEGRALLAHELAHVVQQRQGRAAGVQRRPPWLDESDPLEREAEDMGRPWRRHGTLRPGGRGATLSYREALEVTLPPRPRPPAARVSDTRTRVLAAEQVMFDDLRTYVQGLPARIRTVLAGPAPAGDAWLSSANINVQSALGVLDRLAADLNGPRFVVRFDHPAGTASAASYDSLNDEMSLRPFATPAERTIVAIDLLHEYVHVLQDRAAQDAFAQRTAPQLHTRAEDLQREIGARREHVYFGEMVRVLGDPVPTAAVFGTQLSDRVFRGRFEAERTATTERARRAATRDIRTTVETAYAAQLTTNSSIKTYAVEITSANHALLHWDLSGVASPRDLGEVPPAISSRAALIAHLSPLVSALPEFGRLFDGPGGTRLAIATFAIVFDRDHVAEFGLNAP